MARRLRVGWLGGVVVGVRLGLMTREQLHALDERYYSGGKGGEHVDYSGDAHNLSGLFDWEQPVIERFFAPGGRLLVMGAGGGREVVALARMGYRVDGCEPHPGLVDYATRLLEREGVDATMSVVPRDTVPRAETRYDGIVVGWGTYMLVQGRARRIALLRELRALAVPGAPVLLSFFYRDAGSPFRHDLIARLGSALRRRRGLEPVEEGDALAPNFIHLFTEEEVRAELREGGWEPVLYDTFGTGHAVGIAA
ncbi:MAG TPA: class I SAM-dependent methyltransferase [Longimicrobium sp.]|nr:class I SAM-dependent methyltransferase [Longimicrobium sp.]